MPVSFDEFKAIWFHELKKPTSYDTFKKFRHLSKEECIKALKHCFALKLSGCVSDSVTKCVPKLKCSSYLNSILRAGTDSVLGLATPLDTAESLHILIFNRGEKLEIGGKVIHQDALSLRTPIALSQNTNTPDDSIDIAAAYNNIGDSSCIKYEIHSEELLKAESFPDLLVTSRLILPDFVDTMRSKLKCEAKDDLVVVPFATNLVYATKSSSYLGCCMLGDFCDALSAEKDVPDYITSVPYCVHSIDVSAPVETLLAQRKHPVLWRLYPYFGQKPTHAMSNAEGMIRFSVPGSEAQAHEFLSELRMGRRPSVIMPYITDDKTTLTGNCAQCFKFGKFARCSRCLSVAYCSKDCQKKHWKLHKLQCKK